MAKTCVYLKIYQLALIKGLYYDFYCTLDT